MFTAGTKAARNRQREITITVLHGVTKLVGSNRQGCHGGAAVNTFREMQDFLARIVIIGEVTTDGVDAHVQTTGGDQAFGSLRAPVRRLCAIT